MRYKMMAHVSSAALLMGVTGAARAEKTLNYADLLAHLTDLDQLPLIEPGVYCKQFSSYDRHSRIDEATGKQLDWDANGDAGQYIRIDPNTHEGVMAEMDGPGCIFRIWSANPQGVIRFYFDGDAKPTYEWDFAALFRGKIQPFTPPLVWSRDPRNFESAADCYLPIPFAKSCKVTSLIVDKSGKPGPPRHYYIIDYRTWPKDWRVTSFKLPLGDADRAAVDQTARRWSSARVENFRSTDIALPPGESVVAAEINGPGVIRALRAKLRSSEKWATRKVMLRVFWDGEQTPSIDSPLGDFFGEPKDVPYRSWPMEIGEQINSCFFPMPFHKSAKVMFINEGKMPATVAFSYDFQKGDVSDNRALFHAKYRQEKASTTFDYPLLEATGTGKFVGVCLFPDNIHGGWWGEGDEKVWVDDEKFPSWFGTGSEDYFGDAWGIRYFVNPSHGHPQKNVERLQGCYRWHLGDNIPFYKFFRMTIENYAGQPSEKVKNDYYSVAYWYQLPGGIDFFKEVPVADRIPRGFTAANAIEAETCIQPGQSNAAPIDDEALPQELSAGKGVKLTGRPGATFVFQLPVTEENRYKVTAHPARSVKGREYEIVVDGKKADAWAPLHSGQNAVAVRLLGDSGSGAGELILDYFRMEPYRNLITDWVFIGPFANPDGQGLDIAYPPEKQVDLKARYKGRDGQEAGWQKLSEPSGVIVLNDRLSPKENCVVYGACIVDAPQEGSRTLLVGSDDGVCVWINGKQVWRNAVQRGIQVDADRVEVTLQKGPNLLLVKVEQGQGDVGWAVRFRDPKDELKYSLPK